MSGPRQLLRPPGWNLQVCCPLPTRVILLHFYCPKGLSQPAARRSITDKGCVCECPAEAQASSCVLHAVHLCLCSSVNWWEARASL